MSRHRYSVFALLTLSLAIIITSGGIHAQTAQECYEQGLTLKQAGDIDGAIKLFDKARKKDRSFAEANYELALCYMAQGTVTGRIYAEYALDRALNQDPENSDYLHALGDLYLERSFSVTEARIIIEKLFEKDTTDTRALEKLAGIYQTNYDNTIYRIESRSIFFDVETLDILQPTYEGTVSKTPEYYGRYRNLASLDYMKAMEMNERILALEPENRGALYRKGVLFYDRDDFRSLVSMFESVIERNPSDKDAALFIGLGLARMRDYDGAVRRFTQALESMTPEERAVFENIEYLHPETALNDRGQSDAIPDIDTTGFWYGKDPLFMTGFNERKIEHYCRVIEANLRFSKPDKNIIGWKTDRGRIWIRYGKPYRIIENKRSIINFQEWFYPDMYFQFSTMLNLLTDNYDLHKWPPAPRMQYSIITEEDAFGAFPELYAYRPRGRLFNVPVDIVQFRSGTFENELRLYYGMMLNDISLKFQKDLMTGTLYNGFFLFNDGWMNLATRIDTLNIAETQKEITPSMFFTLDRRLDLQEGRYNLAVELVDPVSGNTGTYRDSLTITPFGYESLQISDILLANSISVIDITKDPSRDNIAVAGNPFHLFGVKQQIYLYFEIYNLFAADEFNRSRYTMEYSLRPLEEEQGVFRKLFNIFKGKEGVAVTSDITVIGRTDNRILVIDHGINKPGEYILTVKVTDNTTGQSTEKTTFIRLY
ncbi:GWxTD domain-containing protein [candidate division KSB1 bacterium]